MSGFITAKTMLLTSRTVTRPFLFTGEITDHHYRMCEQRVKDWAKVATDSEKENFERIQDAILARSTTMTLLQKDRAHCGQVMLYVRGRFRFVDAIFIYETVFEGGSQCRICRTKVQQSAYGDYLGHLHAGYCPLIALQPTLGVFHGDVKFRYLPEDFKMDELPEFTDEELQE